MYFLPLPQGQGSLGPIFFDAARVGFFFSPVGAPEAKALMAAEIVYALTNDKGRTRAERAGERYYKGIRETPYAPFVKLADRRANFTYSCRKAGSANEHMRKVYQQELPHFLEAINPHSSDLRFALPEVMVKELKNEE